MWAARILFITLSYYFVTSDPIQPLPEKLEPNRQMLNYEYVKLPGLLLNSVLTEKLPAVKHDKRVIRNLPESFDPRDKWPKCPSLREIRDQGKCGGCWALSSVAAMTDRMCIYSNGTRYFHFSAEDLLTCSPYPNDGCQGGDPYYTWQYWVDNGIVSGGNYGSNKGCRPYSIATCQNHMTDCTNYKPTPQCKHSCREEYGISYKKDLRRGKTAYTVKGEENMMAELYKNGPIVAGMIIFEDLANYTGGVYQHVDSEPVSAHAIKMMGWGVESGKKYWLVANSWGTGFGEKGFFKILRGTDECGIESMEATAGVPLLDNY